MLMVVIFNSVRKKISFQLTLMLKNLFLYSELCEQAFHVSFKVVHLIIAEGGRKLGSQ